MSDEIYLSDLPEDERIDDGTGTIRARPVRRRPVLLLDMDGIVADFVAAYLQIVNQCTLLRATHADVTEWDIAKALGLQPAQKQDVFAALHLPGVAASLPVCPGAVEGVRALQRYAEIVFVTDPLRRNPTWVHDRERWIEQHFPGISTIYTSAKQHVTGDLFVDDKPENVETWSKWHKWNGRKALLWDAPWNQGGDYRRVHGWAELFDEVRRLK